MSTNHARYCSDAVCGWAGAFACQDGINVIAGTGSMAYGEFNGRAARAGGWGELFSDEGSAYWIAREGLNLFSRMSDGRTARGALYAILRRHFQLQSDLDLCAVIYDKSQNQRSHLAALSTLIAEAATAGDVHASALFSTAADELAQIVDAVHRQLEIPDHATVMVSHSGGIFSAAGSPAGPLTVEACNRRQTLSPRGSTFASGGGSCALRGQIKRRATSRSGSQRFGSAASATRGNVKNIEAENASHVRLHSTATSY